MHQRHISAIRFAAGSHPLEIFNNDYNKCRILGKHTSSSVFDDTKQVADSDEYTNSIQLGYHPFPGNGSIESFAGWVTTKPLVEDYSNQKEQQKYDDLENKSNKNDILAPVLPFFGIGTRQHASTHSLYQETENISPDKDLGDTGDAYYGIGLSSGCPD